MKALAVLAVLLTACGQSAAHAPAKDAAGTVDIAHAPDAAAVQDVHADTGSDVLAILDSTTKSDTAAPTDIAVDAAAPADVSQPKCVDPCDDGDPCTVGDFCEAGKCKPGIKKTWVFTSGGSNTASAAAVALTPEGRVVAVSSTKTSPTESDSDIDVFEPGGGAPFTIHVGGAGQDALHAMHVSGAGAVFAGATTTASAGGWDGWLVHADVLAGKPALKVKQFGGAGDEEFYGVAPAGDGWVLAGYKTLDAQADPHLWLLRVDSQDQPVWDMTFGNTALDAAYDVTALADGGFVAVGETAPDGLEHVWLLKVDANGQQVWSQILHADVESTGWAVAALPGNAVAVAGRVHPKGDVSHAWLARFGNDGKLQAETILDPGIAYALTVRPDGTLVLAGEDGKAATWLALLGTDNTVLWQHGFPGYAAHGVASAPDGGLAVLATAPGAAASSIYRWTARLDASGALCE